MEWARKCISDGANVNYQTEVSYDIPHREINCVMKSSLLAYTSHHNTNMGSDTG